MCKPITSLQAAKCFLEVSGEKPINSLKLQKLVYYSHENHIATTNKPFITDNIEAWTEGPVFPMLYSYIGNCSTQIVTEKDINTDLSNLPEDTKNYIKVIWERLKHFSGTGLSKETHKYDTPWYRVFYPNKSFVQKVLTWVPNDKIITDNIIRQYCRDYRFNVN